MQDNDEVPKYDAVHADDAAIETPDAVAVVDDQDTNAAGNEGDVMSDESVCVRDHFYSIWHPPITQHLCLALIANP